MGGRPPYWLMEIFYKRFFDSKSKSPLGERLTIAFEIQIGVLY
jgi:hypothetical protein